jgi:hypothetical protein
MAERDSESSPVRLTSFGADGLWDMLGRVIPNAEARLERLLLWWLGSLPHIFLAELYSWPLRTIEVRKVA